MNKVSCSRKQQQLLNLGPLDYQASAQTIRPLLPHTHSLACSLTHSLAHSLARSLTHSLTHSLARSLTHSLTHSLIHTTHTHTHTHTHTLQNKSVATQHIINLYVLSLYIQPLIMCWFCFQYIILLQWYLHNIHLVHYPTKDLRRRLGLLKQGVTIFTIT